MNDPVKELPDVVRTCVERYESTNISEYIDTYFTENSFISHSILNQPSRVHGKEYLKGIYKVFRLISINDQVKFHPVMFNEDKTRAAIGKYESIRVKNYKRNTRQDDKFVSDLYMTGILPFNLIFVFTINFIKSFLGFWVAIIGKYLLEKGLFGP